jgi:hypothetical protein
MLKEITHFFSIYKDLEGKRVEIRGWHDAAYARDRVARAIKLFEDGKAAKAGSKAPKEQGNEKAGTAKPANGKTVKA